MKSSLLKILPVMAAVLLATSCSKDENDNTPATAPGGDGVHTVSTSTDTTELVTIPFTIKVNTGKSLTKSELYNQSFIDYVGADQKMTVTCTTNGYSDVTGELSLAKEDGWYYFSGNIQCSKSHAEELTNGDIKLTGTYGTALTKPAYSAKSYADLRSTCAHQYKAEFNFNSENIYLTDQNAYIAITMSKCQHKLDVKSGDAEAVEYSLSDEGEVWVAVPSGAPLTVGSFISKKAVDVEAGKIYTVSRPHCVDLGIPGILWTDHNIGGTNPEDWGDYYAWGETKPYYADGNATVSPCSNWRTIVDRTITGYNWATYSGFDGDDNGENFKKYKDASSATLSNDDDIAHVTDELWSMPTTDEFKALKENCYWVWTDKYGNSNTAGFIIYKVKEGKGKNQVTYGNKQSWQEDYIDLITDYSLSDPHIFLPAAGYRYGQYLLDGGEFGGYWSSSLDTGYPDYAYVLYFRSGYVNPQDYGSRFFGFPVRAVRRSL